MAEIRKLLLALTEFIVGKTRIKTVVRIDSRVLADFEKKMQAFTFVGKDTTNLQAGWQLGIQHAVKVFREGCVIEN